jgi:hypothetical protein
MKLRISALDITTLAVVRFCGSTPSRAQKAYITNSGSDTVSVQRQIKSRQHLGRRDPGWDGGDPGRPQGLCRELSPSPEPSR